MTVHSGGFDPDRAEAPGSRARLVGRLIVTMLGPGFGRLHGAVRRQRLPAGTVVSLVVAVAACGTAGEPNAASPSWTVPASALPSAVPSAVSSAVPSVQASASISPASGGGTFTVYFTDRARFAAGVEPYEVGVERSSSGGVDPRAVLDAFFAGPTDAERAAGLMAVTSGFTGVRSLRVENGVADVFLAGTCASSGPTYTIAGPIRANLLPFAEIAWIKIHDETGETERPTGQVDSIPLCLEP